MNLWKILGIEPTDDISAVKKAYAKRLRIHHPEDDPEGYQKLREAFDQILKRIQRMEQEPEDESEYYDSSTPDKEKEVDDTTAVMPDTIIPTLKIWLDTDVHEAPGIGELNDLFVSQAEALYNDFFSRIKVEDWKTLLKHEAVWNIGNRERLGIRMLEFFSDHHYLPQEIWQLLNSVFNWFDHEEIGSSYTDNSELLKYIQNQLQQEKPLSFTFFRADKPLEYDKFLELRENAKNAFEENNLEKMQQFIGQGKKIYGGDPDMLCLEAKLHLRKNLFTEAVAALTNLLEIKPNDEWVLLYRAIALYESSKKDQAYAQLSNACCVPQKDQVPVIVAKAYMEIGCFENAECWLHRAIKLKRSNIQERYLLSQVYTAIQKRIMDELNYGPGSYALLQRTKELTNKIRKNYKMIDKQKNKGFHKVYMTIMLIFMGIMVILYCINLLVR